VRTVILHSGTDPAELSGHLHQLWRQGAVVGLTEPQQRCSLEGALRGSSEKQELLRFGPAVVIGSGGSSGGRHWCLQPLEHLEAAADASGRWLEFQGIDPEGCTLLDPLPMHHVSGLMPMLRSRRWGADLRWLPAELMKDPAHLNECLPLPADRPVVLSVVPTQLRRLMACSDGITWLRGCAVIWVGGATLSPELADHARREGLALAPCYGATETAAMVCALPPDHFLAGEAGCGHPLDDVGLRIEPRTTAVEVSSERLSPGWLVGGRLIALPLTADGWWRSGDGGRIGPAGLVVEGRLDGAINSGGETVFTEQVEERLRQWARQEGLGLAELLLVPVNDPVWGERLVGLFRDDQPVGEPQESPLSERTMRLQGQLVALTEDFPPSQRPIRWHYCPALERNSLGKWQRGNWKKWLQYQSVPEVKS
jgi:O-succinylbenzoic acid--CoA ligase